MSYEDFLETNVIYGWRDDPAGGYVWDRLNINNAVAGDTDSIMLSFGSISEEISIDEAILLADDIGKKTNEAFPAFCMHAFNCPEGRKTTIKTDREIVADKALFLSKKRYIMHIVDSEGSRVDKLKIMGVEIKKSDTSEATKDFLTRLVNQILDGYDRAQLKESIEKMKEEFYGMPVNQIAKPINVKTLKKCQDMYKATGDMKGFPYQVRAAMFWNQKCGSRDKRIVPGDKIGLIYIKHPETKYVGFPIDMTNFPDWFNELTIDYKTEWSKVNEKLENYLASMGWDMKGYQSSVRMELFGF